MQALRSQETQLEQEAHELPAASAPVHAVLRILPHIFRLLGDILKVLLLGGRGRKLGEAVA